MEELKKKLCQQQSELKCKCKKFDIVAQAYHRRLDEIRCLRRLCEQTDRELAALDGRLKIIKPYRGKEGNTSSKPSKTAKQAFNKLSDHDKNDVLKLLQSMIDGMTKGGDKSAK
jgi:hypothetical protein